MRSDLHKKLQYKGYNYLHNKSYWVGAEEIRMGDIIDVWGISPSLNYTCAAIEVKVSRNDFHSFSQKCKNERAGLIANLCYILCPKDLIQIEDVHKDWGLLWYNEKTDRIMNKKMPVFQDMDDKKKLIALTDFLWSGINTVKKVDRDSIISKRKIFDFASELKVAYGKGLDESYYKGINDTVKNIWEFLGAKKDDRGVYSL